MNYTTNLKIYEAARKEFDKKYAGNIKAIDESKDKIIDLMQELSLSTYKVNKFLVSFRKGTDGKKSTKWKSVVDGLENKLTPELKLICESLKKDNSLTGAPTAPTLKIDMVEALTKQIEGATGKKVILEDFGISKIISWFKKLVPFFSKAVNKFKQDAEELLAIGV